MEPGNEAEIQEVVQAEPRVILASPLRAFAAVDDEPTVSLRGHAGIVEFSPADQVVVVRSGTSLDSLNGELASRGQTIPHRFPLSAGLPDAPLHALVDFNLPHALEASCGTWRDWILGMKVALADGSLRKCGSKAVKNVAGYDVQKLFVGARATLGVIVELTLRTYPLTALPAEALDAGPASGAERLYIHRTTKSCVERLGAEAGLALICFDRATGTVWADLGPTEMLSRRDGDWVVRSGCGLDNLQIRDQTLTSFMRRAKQIFDPGGKLGPGEMGIF